MCGIIGISEGNKNTLITEGMKIMSKRGPDDSGIFADSRVTLGHNRLAIIDLSPTGHQPMVESGLVVISFNGEVYNYRELKDKLIKKGGKFLGGSDTEVIIQGYLLEGKDFFKKIRGMWALALYDIKMDEIILTRDQFGIKPLYYVIQNNKLYFASEIKALKKVLGNFTPNTEKYYQFFNLGYFFGEDTCYNEVKKVLPGEIITWNLSKHNLRREFIPTLIGESKGELSFDDATKIIEDAIIDSVEKHYVADVEVGLLLSGGADSSLLAALSQKIGKNPVCYHLAIPGSIDTEYAREVAQRLKFKLIESELSENSLKAEYEEIESWLDLPTSDVSIIPTSLVYKSINKGSKVVLSGEGGDELFGGYLRHGALAPLDKISESSSFLNLLYSTSNIGLNVINPTVRRIQEKLSTNIINTYLHNSKTIGFPIDDIKLKRELFSYYHNHGYKNLVPSNLFFDQFLYLPDSLMYKNDITSMRSSIEARVPLVDTGVLHAVSQVSNKFKLSPNYLDKKILKTILKKYLPENFVERPKKGFGFSFNQFNTNFFLQDYKRAAKFHIENGDQFGIDDSLRAILSESKAEAICHKFPRFAFSLITNNKIW